VRRRAAHGERAEQRDRVGRGVPLERSREVDLVAVAGADVLEHALDARNVLGAGQRRARRRPQPRCALDDLTREPRSGCVRRGTRRLHVPEPHQGEVGEPRRTIVGSPRHETRLDPFHCVAELEGREPGPEPATEVVEGGPRRRSRDLDHLDRIGGHDPAARGADDRARLVRPTERGDPDQCGGEARLHASEGNARGARNRPYY
jgi:hypothetical protein